MAPTPRAATLMAWPVELSLHYPRRRFLQRWRAFRFYCRLARQVLPLRGFSPPSMTELRRPFPGAPGFLMRNLFPRL
jgi:hypothetical protein